MSIKSHFRLTKPERNGIFFLLLIIIILQLLYFFYPKKSTHFSLSEKETNKLQAYVDSVKMKQQQQQVIISPFNPNYFTPYRAYVLGLDTIALQKLEHFRLQNKFVNSAEEFQKVTGVSDSLLKKLIPYFKFPDWVIRQQKANSNLSKVKNEVVVKTAINKATREDLEKISGIGKTLSERIINYKIALQGFSEISQVAEVYGLSSEVIKKIENQFFVEEIPVIKKYNINDASLKELMSNVYINYNLAQQILLYRSKHGHIDSVDDLSEIDDFPVEKIKRIKLYLEAY
ncbi:ComEA family DNA-binding protein [Zhouia sp. PK063]|uniref:ComEA family DNA-binding protein n=1 Tax=Zhouia sp. PK063 TaxID=3373602 RepID=UPI0037BB1DAE